MSYSNYQPKILMSTVFVWKGCQIFPLVMTVIMWDAGQLCCASGLCVFQWVCAIHLVLFTVECVSSWRRARHHTIITDTLKQQQKWEFAAQENLNTLIRRWEIIKLFVCLSHTWALLNIEVYLNTVIITCIETVIVILILMGFIFDDFVMNSY